MQYETTLTYSIPTAFSSLPLTLSPLSSSCHMLSLIDYFLFFFPNTFLSHTQNPCFFLKLHNQLFSDSNCAPVTTKLYITSICTSLCVYVCVCSLRPLWGAGLQKSLFISRLTHYTIDHSPVDGFSPTAAFPDVQAALFLLMNPLFVQ